MPSISAEIAVQSTPVILAQTFTSDPALALHSLETTAPLYILATTTDRLGFARPETPMKFILQP